MSQIHTNSYGHRLTYRSPEPLQHQLEVQPKGQMPKAKNQKAEGRGQMPEVNGQTENQIPRIHAPAAGIAMQGQRVEARCQSPKGRCQRPEAVMLINREYNCSSSKGHLQSRHE